MFSEIVSGIFGGFTDVLTELATGVKTTVENLLWANPEATTGKVLSDFAQFGFAVMGIAMAMGIGYLGINLIRQKI